MSILRKMMEKDRARILWLFDERCVRCWAPSRTIHEIEPISHGSHATNWKNRVVICKTCHNWAHDVGTKISIPILKALRQEFLIKKFLLDEPK